MCYLFYIVPSNDTLIYMYSKVLFPILMHIVKHLITSRYLLLLVVVFLHTCDVTDTGGDCCCVWHRHLPCDHRQHLRRLRLGSHQEQLSGGDHRNGSLHQLLRHHAPQRGELLPFIDSRGAEMQWYIRSSRR